jgi:Ser/Thr protein kinase RdoA (MazF antagonist)
LRRASYPHTQGWTRITRLQIPSEAGDAISAWSIGEVLTCRLVKRGVVNRNFIVGTSQARYVLRQVSHAHHKSPRDLKFELSYLDYLKQSNFQYSIPSAIPTKNGSSFVTVQGHYYWLYRFLEGKVVERLDQPGLAQLAQMMARYHALIEESNLYNGKPASGLYNAAPTLNEIEDNRLEILGKNKASLHEKMFLEEAARLTPILHGLEDSSHSNLGSYPIHRDLIPENLVWKQGKLVSVIDFEHVSQSNDPVVKDIAVSMQYCCRNRKNKQQLDIGPAKRFLQSYRKHHSLSDEEIRLIPDLITVGFVEDFIYAFWMLRNDPRRANALQLPLYSRAAQWEHSKREKVGRALLN